MKLFVAAQLGEEVRDALAEYQDVMRRAGVTGTYPSADLLHITLAFIGEYGDPDAVTDALQTVRFRPFEIFLDGVGAFGDTWWAGTSGQGDAEKLARDVRSALAAAGIPYDRKKFRSHITLVRRAYFPGRSIGMLPQLPPVSMTVGGIALLRSDRGKHGMIYTEVGYVPACEDKNDM